MAELTLDILPQPDDETCGPTCLHAVYGFHGDVMDLHDVIREVTPLTTGGTLGVFLGLHALARGYQASLYTYNLELFDPTWFRQNEVVDLSAKLRAQAECKPDERLRAATDGYLEFLRLGGEIRMRDLSPALIRKYLSRNVPLLTGLSSTYLYGERREINPSQEPHDVRGVPQGHFVVLRGYNRDTKQVRVADPYHKNPWSKELDYEVPIERAVTAILLGVLTYDANLLVIQPVPSAARTAGR